MIRTGFIPITPRRQTSHVTRGSPKDDPIAGKYCLKAKIPLYKAKGPDTRQIGDVTSWNRNTDTVIAAEEVAKEFCRQNNMRPGETELVFQMECEREIDDTVTIRVYDDADIR